MSRHRFVKNLVEDDYYDGYDDDDDYYEDDEDYYEDGAQGAGYSAPSAASGFSLTASASASASASAAGTAVPPAKPASTLGTSAGISHPPPGWGKPSVATSVKPGISAPPAGWGKPESADRASAAAASATKNDRVAGIAKPPPGWGHPSTKHNNAASHVSQKATAPAAAAVVSIGNSKHSNTNANVGGIAKPPPGWGKPASAKKHQQSHRSQQSNAVSSAGPPRSTVSASATSTTAATAKAATASPARSKRPVPEALKNSTTSQLSMVVLGHVDAGKSTLMGQLLVQVGQIAKRTADKTNLAWLLDEDESEREHGVTMQIGTKSFSTPKHDIIILDSPGHADYIPIMITGASQADVAILVVPATRGEFEAGFQHGQTKEHILLARGLGVTQIIVAVNKLDVIGWDQHRYEQIKQDVTAYLLQQQFGPKRIRFVPLSGLTGENVKTVTAASSDKLRSWYNGPTLLEAIDAFQPANRQLGKPFRFIITDVSVEGKGVVANGRVVQGFCRVGDRCNVLPIGDAVTISKLEHLRPPSGSNGDSVSLDRLSIAQAGDTVELVIAGIDILRLSVGSVLAPADFSLHPKISKKMKAKVVVREALKLPIIRGSQALFHMHSLDIPCTFSQLISVDTLPAALKSTQAATTTNAGSSASSKPRKPRSLPSGCTATVEITLQDAVCVEAFSDCRALGRFVMRRGGDTIAVGIVDSVML